MSNNFIGVGEVMATNILKSFTNLEIMEGLDNWGRPGIYTQVPMSYLIKLEHYGKLSSEHRRSSADICIITKEHDLIAVRIQGVGHGEGSLKGIGKSNFDSVQKFWLEESKCHVISLARWNCPSLLIKKDVEGSKKEILYMFKDAGFENLVSNSI